MSRPVFSLVPLIGGAIVLCALPGCRTFTNPGEVSKVYESEDGTDSVYRISWDATRRGTFVVRTEDGIKFISEPPPDAALDTIMKLSASINPTAAGTGGGGSADVHETIQALTRAIEISFLRESLYRAGEAYVNGGLKKGEYEKYLNRITLAATFLIGLNKNPNLTMDDILNLLRDELAAVAEDTREKEAELALALRGSDLPESVASIMSRQEYIDELEDELAELRRRKAELTDLLNVTLEMKQQSR